ncbi:MAG: TRAP transporter substrate-binding protein DctP [Pseudomonadota bacterium]
MVANILGPWRGLFRLCIAALLAAAFLLAPAGAAMAKDVYTIKAISAFPKNHPHNLGLPLFIKLVEEKSGGRLKISWLGGPEVVKTFDQAEALRRGSVDMLLYNPFSFFKPLGAIFMCRGLSQIPAWQERQTGAFDLWVKVFREKVNAEYLGSLNSLVPFRLFLNKKITGVDGLKGLKIRVAPLYMPWMKALGAKPITIPPMEIYTAMQRGVVDGFVWPAYAIPGLGWHEVTKYMVIPGAFQIEPATIVNLNKFNSLPKDLQKVLKDVTEIMEGIDTARSLVRMETDWKIMSAAGMQKLVLPPADAKKFVDTANDVTWAYVIEQAPKYGPQMRKLTTKK